MRGPSRSAPRRPAADAATVPDETWIAEGCKRGWFLLTKDKRIRYRAQELVALHSGHLFCVVGGNMTIEAMTLRTARRHASHRITRALASESTGFWYIDHAGR